MTKQECLGRETRKGRKERFTSGVYLVYAVFLKSGLVLPTFPPLILEKSWLKQTNKQTIKQKKLKPSTKSNTLLKVPVGRTSRPPEGRPLWVCVAGGFQHNFSVAAIPCVPCSLMNESFWCGNKYVMDDCSGSPPVGCEAFLCGGGEQCTQSFFKEILKSIWYLTIHGPSLLLHIPQGYRCIMVNNILLKSII